MVPQLLSSDKVVDVLCVPSRADSQVQVWRRQSSPTVAAVEKSVEIPHVFLDKVVDTPVVYNDRGHGPDVQFLDKVIDVSVAVQRHVSMVFEVVLTVQFLDKVIDVSVAVQRHVSMVLQTVLSRTRMLTCPCCARQVPMGPDVEKTCGGVADAVLRGLDVL